MHSKINIKNQYVPRVNQVNKDINNIRLKMHKTIIFADLD